MFRGSAIAFDLMSSIVAKHALLGPIFRVGNSQKSLGARSVEHGGRVKTGMFSRRGTATQQVMCGSARFVMQKPLALPLVAPRPPNYTARRARIDDRQQSVRAVRTRSAPNFRYQESRELFNCPSYIYFGGFLPIKTRTYLQPTYSLMANRNCVRCPWRRRRLGCEVGPSLSR
jgi:hypothetical protein